MDIGNLTDFNHCTELCKYSSLVSFQMDKIVCKILLKAHAEFLYERYNCSTLLLHYFMSLRTVGDVLLTQKGKLDVTKVENLLSSSKGKKEKSFFFFFFPLQGDFVTVIKRTHSSFQNSFLWPRLVTA